MKEVYLPVCVEVYEDGTIGGIRIDWEGAPWSNVDGEPNVWDGEDWTRDREAEDRAQSAFYSIMCPDCGSKEA